MAQLQEKLTEWQNAITYQLQKQIQDQPTLITSAGVSKLLLLLAFNHSLKTEKELFFYSAVATALAKSVQLKVSTEKK